MPRQQSHANNTITARTHYHELGEAASLVGRGAFKARLSHDGNSAGGAAALHGLSDHKAPIQPHIAEGF